MIAVRNWFPNGCMAPNGCDDPDCRLCTVIADLPLNGRIAAAVDADVHEREHKNAARDGAPKLAAEKERRHPMFEKRRRQGPHRGNA